MSEKKVGSSLHSGETMDTTYPLLDTVTVVVRPESRLFAYSEDEGGPLAIEQFRMLHSYILQHQSRSPVKRIAITSALRGEGKTHVAANLALTIGSEQDRKVLLVDTDTRKPDVNRVLGISNDCGLTDLLRNGHDVWKGIRKVEGTNLFVLTAGTPIQQPMTPSATVALRALLDQISPAFDLVVMDCPPLLSVANAPQLARLSDAVLLVLRAHKSTRDAVKRAKGLLQGHPILGTVFSGVDFSTSSYSQYYEDHGQPERSQQQNPLSIVAASSPVTEASSAPPLTAIPSRSEIPVIHADRKQDNMSERSESVSAADGTGHSTPLRVKPFLGIIAILTLLTTGGLVWRLRTAEAQSSDSTNAPSKPFAESTPPKSLRRQPSGYPAAVPSKPSPGVPSTMGVEANRFSLVTDVRHWSSPDATTVVVDVEGDARYDSNRLTNPDRIYFDLQNARLRPSLLGKSLNLTDPYVSKIRVSELKPGVARVTLETNGTVDYTVNLVQHPSQLRIEVHGGGHPPSSDAGSTSSESEASW
jgi:protein-tyrosine kinase